MRIAAIDIGTNSVLMLICDIANKSVSVVKDYSRIPRLGENILNTKMISQNAFFSTCEVLSFYFEECQKLNVNHILAVGTAVFRDALNGQEIAEKFSSILKTHINILSGEDEAQLSYISCTKPNNTEAQIVIDVGGGSTEIIYGRNSSILTRFSIPIGAAKVKEKMEIDPPSTADLKIAAGFIANQISEFDSIIKTLPLSSKIICVGGTITTLAFILSGLKEYNPEIVDSLSIDYNDNFNLFEELKLIPSLNISTKFNINPKRADILLSGQLILLELQKLFNYSNFSVSSKGIRYGMIQDYINKNS